MAKKFEIYQIDAFTEKPFQGNPAGVTFGDELTPEEMQLIAREMNLAETAFLSNSDKADYNLRWFTPAVEVNLCGHATIASLHFLNEHKLLKNNSAIKFDTRSGILKCKFEDGKYFMQIPVFKTKEYTGSRNEIFETLGISADESDENVPFIITEHEYLYVYLKKLDSLGNVKPDFKRLLKLSKENNFGGLVIFSTETVDETSSAHIRFFAPFYGIDEDPVTGSANGPLLTVLLKLGFIKDEGKDINLTFEQGDFINRRGRIGVSYFISDNELYISGNAVTIFKGDMSF